MKIRNGFVSNSSSSSFCIFGFKVKDVLPKDEEACEEFLKNVYSGKILKDIELLGDDDDYGFIGYVIVDVSDCDSIDNCEISLSELQERIKGLQKKLKITIEPKIYMGTRSC